MAVPNPSQYSKSDLEFSKHRVTSGLTAVAVVNPDGTPITGSGGGGATDVNLKDVGGAAIGLGQTTKSQSIPVTIASDQSAIPTTPAADGTPATQNITAQDTASTTTAVANNQSYITGTPTAGSVASFAVASLETVKIFVSGTWTGTLAVEISVDGGTTWIPTVIHQTGIYFTVGLFTNNFTGGTNVSGCTNFRVRSTATWTGTATVLVITSVNINAAYIANILLDSLGNLKAVLGTSGATIGSVKITDGTNTVSIDGSGNIRAVLGTSNAAIGAVYPAGSAIQPGVTPDFRATLSNTLIGLKNQAGRLYGYNFFNPGTSVAYVQIFNKASASVTLGVTAPTLSIALPSNANASIGDDVNFTIPITMADPINPGLTYCATSTVNGSTAPATAIVANLYYL